MTALIYASEAQTDNSGLIKLLIKSGAHGTLKAGNPVCELPIIFASFFRNYKNFIIFATKKVYGCV